MAYNQKSGLGNAASYEVSGVPFASGGLDSTGTSALKIEFPYVTRWITINNHDSDQDLKCAFSENGLNGSNYFLIEDVGSGAIATTHTVRMELKVNEMWFTGSADFDVVAGLTGIEREYIPDNWSGSIGVG